MKIKFLTLSCIAFYLSIIPGFVHAKEINNTQKSNEICSLINDTIILKTPCSVDQLNKTINFEISLNAKRASSMCGSVKRIANASGWSLPNAWEIQIKTTETGDKSVAKCSYQPGEIFG